MSDPLASSAAILDRLQKLEIENLALQRATSETLYIQAHLILMLDILFRTRNLNQEIQIGFPASPILPSKRFDELWNRAFDALMDLKKRDD